MSDQTTIRHLAKAIANELANGGYIATYPEIRALDRAEGNLLCKKCSYPVSIQDAACPKCGTRQAIDGDGAFWKCVDCNMPISDPSTPKCPKCSGEKVRKAGPEPYECIKCGHGISDLEMPACPACGETRVVKRNHGHPSRTVVS